MKPIWRKAGHFGTGLGVMSFLLLYQHAVGHGWSAVIEQLLTYYSELKDLVFSKLYIHALAQALLHLLRVWFEIPIDLAPHWSDVVVLLGLYLGARASSYWNAGLKSRALFRAVFGALVSLTGGVLSAVVSADTWFGNLQVLGAVLVSLLVFEMIDAAWSASFFRKSGLSWMKDWIRYLQFSAPSLAIGIVPLIIAGISSPQSPTSAGPNIGMICLIIYVVMLAAYWVYRGYRSSQNGDKHGSGYERFMASSNTQIGLQMFIVLAAAFIIIVMDAGYNLAS